MPIEVLEIRSAPTRKPGAPIRFGRGEYYVSILGKPSVTEPWMMQFGGHHLAINVTMAGRENVLAPTHTGAQPASYSVDGKLVRPLGDENDRAFELINALTPEQQKQAILGFEVRNLVLGPGTDGKTIAPEGVRASAFTPAQRTLLLALVREWVGILEDQAATAKMKEIEVGSERHLFRVGRPDDQRQGRLFPRSGAGRLHRVRAARRGGDQRRPHSHHLSRARKRLRGEGGAAVKALGAAVLVLLAIVRRGVRRTSSTSICRPPACRSRAIELTLEIDLTPGVTIAPSHRRDCSTRMPTARSCRPRPSAYGRAVLSDLS